MVARHFLDAVGAGPQRILVFIFRVEGSMNRESGPDAEAVTVVSVNGAGEACTVSQTDCAKFQKSTFN